jgi:hypothetical protein
MATRLKGDGDRSTIPIHARLTCGDPDRVRQCLEDSLSIHNRLRLMHLRLALYGASVSVRQSPSTQNTKGQHQLDDALMEGMSNLAVNTGASLEALVKLIRGETKEDPRPNKALRPRDYGWLLRGYEHQDLLVDAATYGLQPVWRWPEPDAAEEVKNHQSANRYLNGVIRSVRSGQDGGQYLVVRDELLNQWQNIQISPYGAVEKKDVDPDDEILLIQDISYPKPRSTNDASHQRNRSVGANLSRRRSLLCQAPNGLARRLSQARKGARPIRRMEPWNNPAFLILACRLSAWRLD